MESKLLLDGLLILAGYLIGSISNAVVVSRLLGITDPRGVGSGNAGATNMLRHAGKGPAAVVFFGDVSKGLVAALVAASVSSGSPVPSLVGAAACLGHMWPAYFGFRGGKGVATYCGALFGLNPWLGLLFVAVWTGVAALSRFSSLGSIIACTMAPVVAYLIFRLPIHDSAVLALLSAVIIWRHRENVRRLIKGEESRLGRSRS